MRKIILLYIILLSTSLPLVYSFQKVKSYVRNKKDVAYKMCYSEFEGHPIYCVNIPCDGFEKRDEVFTIWINDSSKIQRLLVQLARAKPAPEFNNQVVVARKLHIYYRSGKIDIICMDYTHTILYNGISMQLPIEEFGWDDFYKVIGVDMHKRFSH